MFTVAVEAAISSNPYPTKGKPKYNVLIYFVTSKITYQDNPRNKHYLSFVCRFLVLSCQAITSSSFSPSKMRIRAWAALSHLLVTFRSQKKKYIKIMTLTQTYFPKSKGLKVMESARRLTHSTLSS